VATKKQVRRRQKERRHEWEEVYVDAEGNVVDVADEAEEKPARAAKTQPARRAQARPGRTINPPSWNRVLKRGLIFAPLMYITVALLAPDGATLAQNVTQTAFLLMVFLPFSYAMDALTYRMWRRRTGEPDARAKKT
jgi:hypothetical protein